VTKSARSRSDPQFARLASWLPVDWAVAAYTAAVGVFALVYAPAIKGWPFLVAGHGLLLVLIAALPPRGHRWEQSRSSDGPWQRRLRKTGKFLRYTYPALLLTAFFEEVHLTANAVMPDQPYWFEPYLYAADRELFGTTPAVAISRPRVPLLDELMHAFYFSYYLLIIGGIVLAWLGPTRGRPTPGVGFNTTMTSMMLGFFLAYVWYPFLPARGPWENPEVMAGLRGFDGVIFTPLVEWIIAGAAVSGGCFPSAHVAGTWGLTVGLTAAHRRQAVVFAALAVGLSVACVYTRYHHAVDVFAGIVVGVAGGVAGRALTRGEIGVRS
jgi:membrane-associated phospholipid phosphatase